MSPYFFASCRAPSSFSPENPNRKTREIKFERLPWNVLPQVARMRWRPSIFIGRENIISRRRFRLFVLQADVGLINICMGFFKQRAFPPAEQLYVNKDFRLVLFKVTFLCSGYEKFLRLYTSSAISSPELGVFRKTDVSWKEMFSKCLLSKLIVILLSKWWALGRNMSAMQIIKITIAKLNTARTKTFWRIMFKSCHCRKSSNTIAMLTLFDDYKTQLSRYHRTHMHLPGSESNTNIYSLCL